jgi:hypothetical protein
MRGEKRKGRINAVSAAPRPDSAHARELPSGEGGKYHTSNAIVSISRGARNRGGAQVSKDKGPAPVRKRVRNLMPELVRRIPALFDACQGDYDRVASDHAGIQRADVLAIVLLDTRKRVAALERGEWRKAA